VRFTGTQRNTLVLQNARIDADYREPQGGFSSGEDYLRVGGKRPAPGRDVHIAQHPGETYSIACGLKPVMKSLIVELAD